VELERRSARLADGLVPFGHVQRVGAMLTLFAGRGGPVERFEELETEPYGTLFRGLLERGCYIAPSQYECLFPSLAHDDDVIDETIAAVSEVFAAASELDRGGTG
jgi:glutamate-1-semialdehyde 2,1-aminomutase